MKLERDTARHLILRAANKHRIRVEPFTMKHIQEAVCRVRRHGWVKPSVLVAAGFNASSNAPGNRPVNEAGRQRPHGYPRPRKPGRHSGAILPTKARGPAPRLPL